MIGHALTGTHSLPLTACCTSHVNATLLSCCAPYDGKRPHLKCNGCDNEQQVILWCSYCGKEQPEHYATYDYRGAVEHFREVQRRKMKRLATRMAKVNMVATVNGKKG